MQDKGYLLLNSSEPEASPMKFPLLEGCGSMFYGNYGYFRMRPTHISLKAYLWKPHNLISLCTIVEKDFYRANLPHEREHINGNTGFDYSDTFLDVRDPDDWSIIVDTYSMQYTADELPQVIHDASPKGLITFDKLTSQFIVVNLHSRLNCTT
jgi:hypothetical protein